MVVLLQGRLVRESFCYRGVLLLGRFVTGAFCCIGRFVIGFFYLNSIMCVSIFKLKECNSPEWCFSNGPKNPRTFFSLKIKSSEKQKCEYKLFLSRSKSLKRLNLRIAENLQNCNKKIRNFQFWSNFYGKILLFNGS